MSKWLVEGSLVRVDPAREAPKFVSEPFLTEEGAKSFTRLLNGNGYSVVVRVADEDDTTQTLTGPALIRWLNL